jgi:hypothetical protein
VDARRKLNVKDGRDDAGMGQKLGYVDEHAANADLATNN